MSVKHLVFEKEIGLIIDIDLQDWVQRTFQKVPDHFWVIPSSQTGRYHPACSNGRAGLIIHTKRVVWLADKICCAWGIEGLPRDIVLAACLLHDTAKAPIGSAPGAYAQHPLNVKKFFAEWNEKEILMTIELCICHHMGRWTPAEIKKPIEKYSLIQLAVYTADYLASMKELVTPCDNDAREYKEKGKK